MIEFCIIMLVVYSQGTLIRVYCTETFGLIHELRRGLSSANVFWYVRMYDLYVCQSLK